MKYIIDIPDDGIITMDQYGWIFHNNGMVATSTSIKCLKPLILCEDCAKCQIDDVYHDYWCDGKKVWKDHFCGYAERRIDE